jgi:hypothetical protein
MKKIIALMLIGAIVLSIGQFAYCGGHGHGGRHYGGGGRGGGGHHHGSWNGWGTFGAIYAGLLGAGLIAAAASDWDRPSCRYVAPAPVCQRTVVYGQPVCPNPPVVTYQRVETTTYQSAPCTSYPPVVYESRTYYGY